MWARLLLLCLALSAVLCGCGGAMASSAQASAPPQPMESGWERRWDDVPGATWQPIELEAARREGHSAASFRTHLPAGAWEDPALFFEAIDTQFDATLDGAPLASYGAHPLLPPKETAGAPWQLIRLPAEYAGKELVIHASSTDPFTIGPLAPVAIGARSDLLELVIRHTLLPTLVGFICFCAGVVALGLTAYRPQDRFHLAFALFAIGVGVSLVATTEGKLLVWNAPGAWRYLLILSRMVRPAAMVAFAALVLAHPPRVLGYVWRGIAALNLGMAAVVLVSFGLYAAVWPVLNAEYWLSLLLVAGVGVAAGWRGDRLGWPLLLAVIAAFAGGLAELSTRAHWTSAHLGWIPVGALAELTALAAIEAQLLARVYRELARHAAELERKNALLTAAEAELHNAVDARDEFLSIASHELRTPLSALRLQLEVINRSPEHAAKSLASVRRQAERLTDLVERLLDVARVRTHRLGLVFEDVDLAALAREAVLRFRAGLADPELLQCDAPSAVTGRWDRVRLEQVLANLISNALKYGGGRPVVVSVQGDEQAAVLTIRDQGHGIAPEDQKRIFERFERATPGRDYAGLGLGLWITRAIVVEHGGQIAVQSAPGQGSTFRVELPRGAKPQLVSGAA